MSLSITEVQFQDQIIQLARLLGFKVAHFRAAKTSKGWRTPVSGDGEGFPDLVLTNPRRGVIFAELKAEKGKLSENQKKWGEYLEEAGAEFYVWRPSQFDEIAEILKSGKARVKA